MPGIFSYVLTWRIKNYTIIEHGVKIAWLMLRHHFVSLVFSVLLFINLLTL
jgi:hypothetical protein